MNAEKLTLNEALEKIAETSFYEDRQITPLGEGKYAVEDTYTEGSDDWYWSYADGLEGPTVSEHSRLHEGYESYTEAGHIRYNLPETVAKLEAGTHTAEFAYAIAHDNDPCNEICDDGNCMCDGLAGWILIAQAYEINEDGELK